MIGDNSMIVVAFDQYHPVIPQRLQTGLDGLRVSGIANITEMIYGLAIHAAEQAERFQYGFRLPVAVCHDSDHHDAFTKFL
jgi:hypothetical protein